MGSEQWFEFTANRLWNARKQVSGARHWAEGARADTGLAEDLFQLECWLDEVIADLRDRKSSAQRQLHLPIV